MENQSQKLRHGKALCGRVFKGFVDSFNALIDFKDNIKGDRDVDGVNGHINIDRKDPFHPIVRCTGCPSQSLPSPSSYTSPGRYEIASISISGSVASMSFSNEYYSCGGKTYGGGEQPSSLTDVTLPAFIALKVDVTGSYPDADIVAYSSFAALQEAQEDEDYYIAPLYKIGSSGSVECDFRIGPVAAMFEFSTPEEE